MNKVKAIDLEQMRSESFEFAIGDTIKVHYRIVEGKTERIQVFEGLCIAMKRSAPAGHSLCARCPMGRGRARLPPALTEDPEDRGGPQGRVRRAKLYYIRDRVGKAAKVAELIQKKST